MFGILGLVGMVVMLGFGVVSWVDPDEAMRLADLVSAFGETLTVGGDRLACDELKVCQCARCSRDCRNVVAMAVMTPGTLKEDTIKLWHRIGVGYFILNAIFRPTSW